MAHKVLTDESFNEKLDGLIEAVGKGKQGDPGVSATHFWEGTVLTVTSASGTSSADLQGPQGPQGPQGLQGVQGPQGEQGVQGVQGTAGEDGKNGVDGKDGEDGVSVQSATVNNNGRLILTLTNGKTIDCGVVKGADGQQGPKGDQGVQGPKGEPFSIAKTYSSVAEMEANFAIDEVPTGGFVLIDTANVNDEDNAKLFYKGYYAYVYLTDLSGAQGIQGPQGIQGIQGPKGDTGSEGPQGPKGDQGIQGVQGEQGPNGKSAYEIWLANGNSGTEATFLASLKGAKGDQGEQGIQGIQGVQGEQGIQGEKGDKGDTGNPGAKGDKGDKGDTGEPGKDGVSVTHSWNGTVLTVTSASGTSSADLKGDKGDKGDKGEPGDPASVDLDGTYPNMTVGKTDKVKTSNVNIEEECPIAIVSPNSTDGYNELYKANNLSYDLKTGDLKATRFSGKTFITEDINANLNSDLLIPSSHVNQIPSLYSVAYAVREAMPVWFLMLAFQAGKDIYSTNHADYNKLVLVANAEGKNMTAADYPSAMAMASYFDRGYRITQLTRGFHNVLLSNIEFSFTEDSDGLKTYTVKIEAEASKQDALRSMNDNEAGLVWLERYFSYFTQGHYTPPSNT